MKSVLLTGCCGFIGSNFANYICEKYPNVQFVNIDKLDYCSNLKNVSSFPNYKFYQCNLNNIDMIRFVLKENNIDTVVHFAAQTHVDNSFGNSIQFTLDNVLGTHNLIECCREHKIQKFIHISTDEVYGEQTMDETCCEKSILKPTNPYAATKAAAEHIVYSYYHSFGFPALITRGNNVYGKFQYPDKLIPKFVHLLNQDKKCTIHGNGSSRRNFIHVDDVVQAIEMILLKGKIGEIYNIGTQNEYSVMQITEKLIELVKNDTNYSDYIEFVEDRKYNDFRYSIHSDKLKQLGWEEKVPFEQGLKQTVKWYLENPNYWN